MAVRLLPLSLAEMFAHSLALEREIAARMAALAALMRKAGASDLAEEFELMAREERAQCEAIETAVAGRELPALEPWEYAWHFARVTTEERPVRTPREAIAAALKAERRAARFYGDVAEHVPDSAVSALAACMLADEYRHLERLEELLAREPLVAADCEGVFDAPRAAN